MKRYKSKDNFLAALIKWICFTLVIVKASLDGYSQRVEYHFGVPGDTTKDYHIAMVPSSKVKATLLLLPGFGEMPRQTIVDSEIPIQASRAGILTIIPALGDWSFFYIDNKSQEKLDQFIEKVFQLYHIDERAFFIGGISLGGTAAMRYLERANKNGSQLRKPVAGFAVDPPLDIERLYKCMTSMSPSKKNSITENENFYVAKRIESEFAANPVSNPQLFWQYSPFSQSDPMHRSIVDLGSTPLRIYVEPDVNWYIDNRGIDYYCINSIDCAAMINWVRAAGNISAELITTTGKGYRVSDKIRHPHSWTIVNSDDLVKWLLSKLHTN